MRGETRDRNQMIRWMAGLAAGVLFASGAVTASAAIWSNLATGTTVGGNQPAGPLNDEELAGRWHQNAIDFESNPGRIYFTRADAVDVGFVRFWNWTDHTAGTMDWELQYLTGADPGNDAHWTTIPGTTESEANYPDYYQVAFTPVNTKGIRWYITKDNNPSGNGNIRYSEFEFYGVDQDGPDITDAAIEIKHSNGTSLLGIVNDNDTTTRYNGDFGAQKVRMLWEGAHRMEHLRIYDEDIGNGLQAFTVEYLKLGGDPDVEADWLSTGISESNNSKPVLNYDLGLLVTRGIRLNITDPSTNGGHEILRLRELEVFAAIPEPATATLAGLGLLGCWSWRRRVRNGR